MKKKINYTLKAEVLKSDLPKKIRKATKRDYEISQFLLGFECPNWVKTDYEDGIVHEFNENLDGLYTECCLNGQNEAFNEAVKINKAFYNRLTRLRARVGKIVQKGNALFLTLTFTDEVLAKTSEKSRRELVQRYLKSAGGQYVANIDFGSKNGREHYHALISCDFIDLDAWNEKQGGIYLEHVRLKDDSKTNTRISKYIAKLTNHAIKETTRRSALMYSR